MKKADRIRLERATKYRVEKSKITPHNYEIRRFIDGEFEALYHVTVKWDKDDPEPSVLWCDCAGFKCQKFAHIAHKHIKIVLNYMAHNEPNHSWYRIRGTGAKTEIEHIGHEQSEM